MTDTTPTPCPFCGAKAALVQWRRDSFEVTCDAECNVSPRTNLYDTANEAIETWNRRAQGIPVEAVRRLAERFEKTGRHYTDDREGDGNHAFGQAMKEAAYQLRRLIPEDGGKDV